MKQIRRTGRERQPASLRSGGDVLRRAIDLHAYASDASHFYLVPESVVVAADADDVAAVMQKSVADGSPVTFRSGGTSLSGQGVTNATLVDVRKNFRAVDVLDDGIRVRVEPGITVRQVNARLSSFGRKLGPDPASEAACTIGGVLANNSSGMSCGIHSNSYQTLESMTLVLPSGTVIDTADADADRQLQEKEPTLHAGLLQLRDRVRGNPDSVATIEHQFSMKNTMGYGLNAFLDFDTAIEILRHIMVGSEGTLGFVAEAVLRTVPQLTHIATGLLVFDDLIAAGNALPALVSSGPAALELVDALSLTVSQADPAAHPLVRQIPVKDHAALLIEFHADSPETLAAQAAHAMTVFGTLPLTFAPALTSDAQSRAELWHMRKGLYAAVAGARPSGTTALLEDVVVPVGVLAETCRRLIALFEKYCYSNSVIFGHAGDGNIHFMLTDRFGEKESLRRYAAFTDELVDLILGAGGSLKAEHGTGRAMSPFVERQYGSELYDIMRELKRLCDPAAILNPGTILTDNDDEHLRHIKATPTVEDEVDRCVECGYCEPVCPSRNLTLTPRQRIVVRRAIVRAEAADDIALAAELHRDYEYSAVQTCAVDGMCQTACPVQINTGDLMKRLRRERPAPVEKFVWKSFAESWGTVSRAAGAALSMASVVPSAVVTSSNVLARSALGTDVLPLWSHELPKGGRSRATRGRREPLQGTPTAVYLPACVNTMFGPARGEGVQSSFEELCRRAGIGLRIPANVDALCCGTPWSSKGFPQGAMIMNHRLVASLLEASDNGQLPIVCDATSCTEGAIQALRTSPAAAHLQIVDAVEFVAERILPGLPPHAKIGRLALHPTCSSTRMEINPALSAVAAAVADFVSVPETWECCAFAGDRGMLHPELTESATRFQAAEVREMVADAHASCNRTCELGMTRATGEEYRHVLEILEELTRP